MLFVILTEDKCQDYILLEQEQMNRINQANRRISFVYVLR